MKKVFLILILSSSFGLFAQVPSDALRLSSYYGYGSARMVSMGGAFGALGSEFSSLSYNPAGLGVFRSSEFSFTPSLKIRNDRAEYLNSAYTDSRSKVFIDNFGLVGTFNKIGGDDEKGLIRLNFGIGYNRLNDFYSETTALGENTSNSIMNLFASSVQGYKPSDIDSFSDANRDVWTSIMAWYTYLINPDEDLLVAGGDTLDYVRALNPGDGVYQDQSISSMGGVGEYTFSLGANISNSLYLGATVGVQNVYYESNVYYTEEAFRSNQPLPNTDLFQSLNYNQSLLITGAGYNFKVGAIYRPLPSLRLGFAVHTPTFYNLSEEYFETMKSQFNVRVVSDETPANLYDYTIESPYKLIGSVAYTFGKKALVSVDYEFIDYAKMRFGKGGDGYKFTPENQAIKSNYKSTFNLKTGAEYWIGSLALRAGYAYYGSPYAEGNPFAASHTDVFSGGFGLVINSVNLDWAYQRLQFNDKYKPYLTATNVHREVSQDRFVFTIGYKF
ncbi:MAG: hypothetical protein RBR40_03475 [Tenuifilaceae bacterium]|nr:hypothetical protein [Tenuifilaceae bacterium]